MGESPGIVLNHEQSATGLLSGGDYRSRDPKLCLAMPVAKDCASGQHGDN